MALPKASEAVMNNGTGTRRYNEIRQAGNSDLSINFKKGGVCCLSVDDLHYDRKAVLEWLVTPKIVTWTS